MNERDVELARQNLVNAMSDVIEKCVKAAVEAEREACAKMCDVHTARQNLFPEERYGAYWLAAAIRARGNK